MLANTSAHSHGLQPHMSGKGVVMGQGAREKADMQHAQASVLGICQSVQHRCLQRLLTMPASANYQSHTMPEAETLQVVEPGSVKVEAFMEVERYSHVMHISSTVTGKLRADWTAWDALRAALPVGTVSGAPKVNFVRIKLLWPMQGVHKLLVDVSHASLAQIETLLQPGHKLATM